jgi:hypothetical protein
MQFIGAYDLSSRFREQKLQVMKVLQAWLDCSRFFLAQFFLLWRLQVFAAN